MQACAANENALLEPASSQGRDSFLDDDDTENATAVAGSGAAHASGTLLCCNSPSSSMFHSALLSLLLREILPMSTHFPILLYCFVGAARGAACSSGLDQDMLRTLDDCPEYVMQWGSEVDADSVPGSLQTSPVMHKGGSANLNGSPLKHRGGAGNGGKPPLSPGQHLQVRRRFHLLASALLSSSSV